MEKLASTQTQGGDQGFDPVAAARSVIPALQKTSANSENLRHVDPSAMATIRDAGLSRMLSPERFGGYELPPSAHIQSCAIVAHGCPAASWVHMVCGAHTFVAGRYSPACQEEIFDTGPDVLIPGTLAPQGTARRIDGGWILSGRWQFGSGVDHGPWLLLGAKCVAENGEDPLPPIHVFVPKDEVEVDDTWYTLGMRGTGSKDLVSEDLFVPEYRTLPTNEMFGGTFEGDVGPLYRLPVAGGLATMLAATVVGMTERGIGAFVDMTKVREDIYMGGGKAASAGIQMRVAEAQGELELAATLIEKNSHILDNAMAENVSPMDLTSRAQIRWNASYAVELCRRATERVFAVAGAHSIYDGSELQRLHRDVNTACHHAIVDFDSIKEVRGRLSLGLKKGAMAV